MIDPYQNYLRISIAQQRLEWLRDGERVSSFAVSTALNGPGERKGSACTPRGWHVIRAKIGGGAVADAVFKGRRATGEVYTPDLAAQHLDRDWILSRILWLGGLEPGFNRYGECDTAWRYIYIHGSPDTGVNGVPLSHGCIRMSSADVISLYNQAYVGLRVFITEFA